MIEFFVGSCLLLLPLYANAASAFIFPVPSWVLGVAVLGVIGYGILKLFFSVAESAVDSASDAIATKKDRDAFKSGLASSREKIKGELFRILATEDASRIIGAADSLASIKKVVTEIYSVEIFDDRHLVGRSVADLIDALEGQIKAYAARGGIQA